jgi:hypothetical protein
MNAKTKIANCNVLPSEADGSEGYVRKLTPFATKREEMTESLQYKDGAINKAREQTTARKRKQTSTRPI